MSGALGVKESTDYIVGIVQDTGSYVHQKRETVNFSLVGVNLDEYKQMNSVAVDLALVIYPFEGKKIIIGRNTAQKYGLNPGSTVDLEINGASSI